MNESNDKNNGTPDEPTMPETVGERLGFFFKEAVRYYGEGAKDHETSQVYERMSCNYTRSALLKAKLVGDNLIQAKAELEKANGLRQEKGKKPVRWLPLLKRKFGDERNPQNFCQRALKTGQRWADENRPF